MRTIRIKTVLSFLMCTVVFLTSNGQIVTPGGTITGSSGVGVTAVGIGNVTTPMSNANKLVISDNLSNGGILKLASTNGQVGDRWWMGFSHGTNTSDGADRARIGVDIQAGGAGRLFFTTGPYTSQQERMRIDENGNIGINVISPATRLHVDGTVRFDNLPVVSGMSSVLTRASNNQLMTGIMRDNGNTISLGDFFSPPSGYFMHVRETGASGGHTIGMDIELFNKTTSSVTGLAANVQGNQTNTGANAFAAGGSNATAGMFGANNATINYGVRSEAKPNISTTNSYGLYAASDNFQSNNPVSAGINNWGILAFGRLIDPPASPSTNNYAIQAYAEVVNGSGINNYGIHARIVGGMTGLPNGTGSFAGYFDAGGQGNGAGFFNGDVWKTGFDNFMSDRKFKEKIVPVEHALETIMKLESRSYLYKSKDAFPSFTFPAGKQYGFIAQEIEKVVPELVKEGINPAQFDKDGNKIADAVTFKSVQYVALIPILTAGIQEQQKMITERDAKITELETRIKALEENKIANTTSTGSGLHQMAGAALYQNAPNPFGEVTSIGYKLPATYNNAQIMVFDMNGRKLKSYPLSGNGEGNISFSGTELISGMYLYSLVIDGQEIDTKRMVINK